MYKLLIVDDEKIERNGIRYLLEDGKLELEIYEAVNGKDALEFLNKTRVDILLTDVKMPFIDGIELIRQAAPLFPDMKIIIFSGYSEFEYAKFAMKMGVEDYVLKPVDPEEFTATMNKVIGELDEMSLKQEYEQESREYIGKHFLYQMVYGNLSNEELDKSKNILDEDILAFHRMILLETDKEFFVRVGNAIEDEIKNAVEEHARYLNLNSQQCLIFLEDKVESGEQRRTALHEMADRLISLLKTNYGETAYVAISESFEPGASSVAEHFKVLESLMQEKFYSTGRFVYEQQDEKDGTDVAEIENDTLMKQIKQDVKMKDILNLRKHFDELSEKYSGKNSYSQVYVKFIFSNLLKEFYDNMPDADEMQQSREIERIYSTSTFDDIKEIMLANIDELEKIFGRNPQMIHREIEDIKQYIYDNYDKDLSVNDLADKVYMAPSYLSFVFKNETGQNLSKFIKAYRMEKAKEMLETTHKKVVTISNEVGYENVSYFCQSFREYFGVSPQKFRDQG
ncbi:MAG: response regulator [Eubacterium sp.]|nr:response regulator [Eubacterium sp.]